MKFLLVSFNAQMILDSFSFFPALSSLISSKFSVEFLCILLKYYQGYPKGEFILFIFLLCNVLSFGLSNILKYEK